MRTAKVLDLLIKGKDRCFVFEETICNKSVEETLTKLLTKEYYIEAVKTKLPFLLIAVNVVDIEGFASVTMSYLYNATDGEGEEV